jgi:hypothetical protein
MKNFRIPFDKENSSPLTKRIWTVEDDRKESNIRVHNINNRKKHIYTLPEPERSVRLKCEELFTDDKILTNENEALNEQYRNLIMEIVKLQSQQDLKSAELKVNELEQGFARQKEIIAEQETILDKVEQLLNIQYYGTEREK